MGLLQLKLSGVLDRHDPLRVGDRDRERIQERRLPRARSARDQDIQLGKHAALEEVNGVGAERAEPGQLGHVQPLVAELADCDERAAEGQRWDHRVDAAPVRKPGVDHRRRLVDAAADLRDHLVDDPPQVRLVVELHACLVEATLSLDPDVVRAVDHDLADAVVDQEPLQRPVAEDVICDL